MKSIVKMLPIAAALVFTGPAAQSHDEKNRHPRADAIASACNKEEFSQHHKDNEYLDMINRQSACLKKNGYEAAYRLGS